MNVSDKRYMMLAIEQARKALEHGDVPFGAVVVRGDEVVAEAFNTEHLDSDITSHAESKAISAACRRLGRDLSNCTLYASSEPCPMCASTALSTRIGRIVYGAARSDLPGAFRERKIGLRELAADTRWPVEVLGGVAKEEAVAVFENVKLPLSGILKKE